MAKKSGQVRVNHDYFRLGRRWDTLRYFVRQGHILAHIADRAKWHWFPRFFLTPAFPTHLEIEASSACQMRCPMCKTTEMVRQGLSRAGHMPFELFLKIIDEAAREPLFSVKFSWRGEPLLNPRIVDMVAYAKKVGIKDVAFLSNGERLDADLSRRLVAAGLDWISISCDGMGETYESIRKPALFSETLAKVRDLRRTRERAGRGKPLIRVQSVHSAIRGQEEAFLRVWDGVADQVNIIADQKRSLDQRDYRHDPSYLCPSPWQRMCIGWDGKVTQCYSDYMEGNVLGDARSQTLREIWHGEPFQELRRLMKSGRRLATKPCRTCSDGGVLEEEIITMGGRRIKVAHYAHQGIDVRRLPRSGKRSPS